MRGNDEEGLDVVLVEEGVALVSEARLHLVVSVQALQRGAGDVDLAENHKKNTHDGNKKSSCSSLGRFYYCSLSYGYNLCIFWGYIFVGFVIELWQSE